MSHDTSKYYLSGELTEDCTGLVIDHGKAVSRVLQKWAGKPLEIIITRLWNRRSLNQNRYLYGVIIPCIRNHIRNTEGRTVSQDAAKAHIYKNILQQEIQFEELDGMEYMTFKGKRFSKMSTVEFNLAKEAVQEYYLKQGLVIPDPVKRNLLNDYAYYGID